MLPFEYIKSELNNFITKFPKTRVRYENDNNSNTHSIEVVPNEIYRLDKDYIIWEDIFFDAFINEFPNQNICFISDDAIVGLDKIDFELCGKEYMSIFNIIPNACSFNLSTNINILSQENKIQSKPKNGDYVQLTTRPDLITNLIESFKVNAIPQGEDNYSLAA